MLLRMLNTRQHKSRHLPDKRRRMQTLPFLKQRLQQTLALGIVWIDAKRERFQCAIGVVACAHYLLLA
ncbi:hypothetical protein D3C86_1845810 [compost metagenome]